MANQVKCTEFKINTGIPDCPVHFSHEGVIEVPLGKVFTDVEIAAMQATLNTGVIAASKKDRFFPFPALTGEDLQGGDTVEVEFDNGQTITTWENPYKLESKFYSGGIPANNALRSRNGSNMAFLFYGKIGGSYAIVGSVINGEKKGVPAENFWCKPQVWGAFKKESQYGWKATVKTPYMNEQMWYQQVDFYPADITGLRHVELISANTVPISAGGVAEFYVREKGYGNDFAVDYAAELGGIVLANFTAKNTATGLAIPVTARSVSGGKLIYTLTVADANYPAVNGQITILPPSIATLTAAGILKTEMQEVIITRTV